MSKETPLPKLPKGWRYDRHDSCSDDSGSPWIEVHSPHNEGDYVLVETNVVEHAIKWDMVEVFIEGQDDPYDMKDLAKLERRIAALRFVAKKMRAWAIAENSRPLDPWEENP